MRCLRALLCGVGSLHPALPATLHTRVRGSEQGWRRFVVRPVFFLSPPSVQRQPVLDSTAAERQRRLLHQIVQALH